MNNKQGVDIMNNLEYVIPIQIDEDCEKMNQNLGTNFKGTEWHINECLDNIMDLIHKVGDEHGWYLYDQIKVKVEVIYEPEDK